MEINKFHFRSQLPFFGPMEVGGFLEGMNNEIYFLCTRAGHVQRKQDDEIPKMFIGKPRGGKPVGNPKLGWENLMQKD